MGRPTARVLGVQPRRTLYLGRDGRDPGKLRGQDVRMIREIGERALLFLVPFAIYGVYLLLVLRQRPTRPPTPWALLFITGLILFVARFVYVGLTGGET